MSIIDFFCNGNILGNNRHGLRLPLLLGRLHMGLIFSGQSSSSSSRKSNSDRCTLRNFLFIVIILATKCGSSAYPNRNADHNQKVHLLSKDTSTMTSVYNYADDDSKTYHVLPRPFQNAAKNHYDGDLQDYPLQHIISIQPNEHFRVPDHSSTVNGHYIGDRARENEVENVKSVGYVLKGMILPMLISVTLSFGFVIYKNRAKKARFQAIQNAVESARLNPNQIPSGGHPNAGLVSNALLSVLDTRGEWSLLSGGDHVDHARLLEGDDYVGEGGETARHKPFMSDRPPDYSSVFDPPSYEQAIRTSLIGETSDKLNSPVHYRRKTSVSVLDGSNQPLLPPTFPLVFSLEIATRSTYSQTCETGANQETGSE